MEITWLRVDLVLKRARPHKVVQLSPMRRSAPPPFALDAAFKRHFKQVFNALEWPAIVDKTGTVQPAFVRRLLGAYPRRPA